MIGKKRTKVDFYMKSGNSFSIKFEKFTVKHKEDGSITGFTWTNPDKQHTIDIEQVEAVIIN